MGAKKYREWTPRQSYLMPPSPTQWLPEGHLVYFLLDLIERVDIRPIEIAIEAKDPRGERPYSPRWMLLLLVYGYCTGVFSSRKLERATVEDVAFLVLAGGVHPHFTSINAFRLQHREAFVQLYVQIAQVCKAAGLVKLGHVSLDGSKILANASKHKAMSYERMQEEEARLRAEINELLANADAADRRDDERYGVGEAPEDLPQELSRREKRIARIEEAMRGLKREAARVRAEQLLDSAVGQWQKSEDPSVTDAERARAATRAAKSEAQAAELDPPDDDDAPPSSSDDLPHHRVPTDPNGVPEPQAQRNFTDPDSRIMVAGGTYVQAYNVQVVVDEESQVIVAQAVTNQPPDVEHLAPMLARVTDTVGSPERLTADSGYYSDANAQTCNALGIDAHIAVGRTPHGESVGPVRSLSATKTAMRDKLDSAEGHAVYARRKVIVEPVFGQIKAALGFRRFSLRAIAKVRCEWALVCLAHHLLKLFRARPATRVAVAV